jgi:predicted dehydrogenase
VEQIIRWGILAPGRISRVFANALRESAGAELVAVGSRDRGRADAFAAEFGAPTAYGSYEELAADPHVDAIYIGSPHAFHEADAVLCLRHGKHVLCEKALALNAGQVEHMISVAREEDRLLMEAMWTRFLPAMVRVRRLVAEGAIGTPRFLTADFGFKAAFDPHSRLFDPALGGGALLDVGIYPLSLAFMLFGEPTEITGFANLAATGVDQESVVLLRHGQGELAMLASSFTIDTARRALIEGTAGSIRIDDGWWKCKRITVVKNGGEPETLDFPFRGAGYAYEAEEFMDLIRAGKRDSAVMPLAESLAIMRTMDALRARWGFRYPGE